MKNKFPYFTGCILLAGFFSACKTADCGCGNNTPYEKRKMKVSLLNSEKNSTFAAQKDEYSNNLLT